MSMIVICIHGTFGVLEGAQRKRGNAVDIPPYPLLKTNRSQYPF